MSEKIVHFDTDLIADEASAAVFEDDDNGQEGELRIKNSVLRDFLNENLTKKQKCYIMLYYRDKLTMEQIADKCGVSRSTVSRTIYRGRQKLFAGAGRGAFRRLLGKED